MEMTSNTMRKKVIEYVNHADENVLELVYKMLKIYEGEDDSSLMDKNQKEEVENRTALLKAGKLKTSSWKEVKKNARMN
jgi:hypothetical protein